MDSLLKLSSSNAAQAFLFALSYNVLYAIIAAIGTKEMAVTGVIFNFALLYYLPGIAFGLVTTSLVGQSLGRCNNEDAEQWTSEIASLATKSLGILSLPILITPALLLGIYISDTETVELGINAMRLLGVSLFIEAYSLIKMHALLGAGDSHRVFYISTIMQWLVYIPLGWLLATYMELGLSGIWTSNLLVQIILAYTYTKMWRRGNWKKINI